MSSPSDPLEASVRAKVKATLAKSLTAELSDLLEAKLAQSFATGTSYKSAFRTLTALLKPKSADVLTADPSIPLTGSKKSQVLASDFENVIVDLQSKKLSVGKLVNRVQELEKTKKGLLHEASVSASAEAPLAQQQLELEYARAQKARVTGLITARIRAAKDAVATGGLEDPKPWAEIADASMEMFYTSAPNTAYLNQAIKSYARVEALSTEYLNTHPSFFLKRAAIHTISENFEAAITDLQSFASKAPVVLPASAVAASAAASASPAAASYAALAVPRINAITAYVNTVSKLVHTKYNRAEKDLRQLIRELPNPSREQLQREMSAISLLKEGENTGKAIIVRVLGKVDQTSLYALQKNTAADGTPLPLLSVHESLETSFTTPRSYIVMDSEGVCACLSLYNVMGDQTKQKAITQGDLVITVDPFVHEVALTTNDEKKGFRSIQVQNPHSIMVNLQPYNEEDIVPVPQ